MSTLICTLSLIGGFANRGKWWPNCIFFPNTCKYIPPTLPQFFSSVLNGEIKDNNYRASRRLDGRQWLLQLLNMAYSFAQIVQVSTDLALYCSGMESVRCPYLEGTHWCIQTEAQKICCSSSREWWDLDNSPSLWNILMGVWMLDDTTAVCVVTQWCQCDSARPQIMNTMTSPSEISSSHWGNHIFLQNMFHFLIIIIIV